MAKGLLHAEDLGLGELELARIIVRTPQDPRLVAGDVGDYNLVVVELSSTACDLFVVGSLRRILRP